ncbi:MAG TPA: hypothetical protein ENI87_03930 [bacterium]|nr:hypothetical protein [bacterium]
MHAHGEPHDEQKILRELQRQLAQAPPSDSLVARRQHREDRRQRERRAAERVAAQLRATVHRSDAAAVPPAESESARDAAPGVADDADPRESESWFRALPEPERQRLRAIWHQQRHRFDHRGMRARKRIGRAMVFSGLWFAVMACLQAPMLGGFDLLPLLLLAGALAGGAASALGGGRMTYSLAGGLGYFAVMLPSILAMPYVLSTLMVAVYGMGVIGMDGEMRRSAGYRDD